jgi:hypothetical protein
LFSVFTQPDGFAVSSFVLVFTQFDRRVTLRRLLSAGCQMEARAVVCLKARRSAVVGPHPRGRFSGGRDPRQQAIDFGEYQLDPKSP